ALQDGGVYTFAADGATSPLTDDEGATLRLAFEGQASPPLPGPGERLLIVREPGRRGTEPLPFVVLPAGQAYAPPLPASEHPGALPLDVAGLARFFSVEDSWNWDAFQTVRLVRAFATTPPADGVLEVDLERGRLRVGPRQKPGSLKVRYFRPFDV